MSVTKRILNTSTCNTRTFKEDVKGKHNMCGLSWHSFASRHLFFPTAHPLDNHRSDFKMFTTLVEPRAAGEWFHCKVLIPSVGTEAQITYNKRNYTNKQLSPSGNSVVWFLQKDQNFLAFWRHFHVTKGIDHGKQDATERTLRRRGTHWLQMQHFVTLIHHKTVQKEGSLVKCFSTLEEKFRVSARPRNIHYIFLQ